MCKAPNYFEVSKLVITHQPTLRAYPPNKILSSSIFLHDESWSGFYYGVLESKSYCASTTIRMFTAVWKRETGQSTSTWNYCNYSILYTEQYTSVHVLWLYLPSSRSPFMESEHAWRRCKVSISIIFRSRSDRPLSNTRKDINHSQYREVYCTEYGWTRST